MKIFKYLIPLLFFSTTLVADDKKQNCEITLFLYNKAKTQKEKNYYLKSYEEEDCFSTHTYKVERTKDEEIEYLEGRIEELIRENRSLKNEIRKLKNR